MDSRVTDKTKARARAARPAYCAPITDASAGSASATWRVRELLSPDTVGRAPEDGLSLGNREEALPPGFSADPLPLRNGSLPTPSCEVTPLGWGTVVAAPGTAAEEVAAELEADADGDADGDAGGAVTVIGSDAFGYGVLTFVPLAVAVSFTDLTEVADFAICTCALNGMCCVPESTVPMEHEFFPFVAQPELNTGFRLVGAAASVSFTLLTLPPWDHTFTFHWAVWPRATLVSSRCTLTQRDVGLPASVCMTLSSVAVTGAPASSWLETAVVLAVC